MDFFYKGIGDLKILKGILMIDIFSKFMNVMILKRKKEEDLINEIIEYFHKLEKKSINIYMNRI